jgi:hypothetical protein
VSLVNLIVVQIGEACFAFAEQQVEQVAPWAPRAGSAIPFTSALRLPVGEPCERALRVLRPQGGWMDFGIPAALSQHSVKSASLTRVPALLKRLRAPDYVAGFFRSEAQVATVIDLRRLAEEVDPQRRAPAP